MVIPGAAAQPTITIGKILYTAVGSDSTINRIVVIDDDGTDGRVVTEGRASWAQGWSPDGKSFLMTELIADRTQLFRVNVRTGKTIQLTSGESSYFRASWSPTGDWIAVTQVDSQGERLVLLSPDGSLARVLVAGQVIFGAWSPDGSHVIFSDAEHVLWLMDITTLAAARIPLEGFLGDDVRVSDWRDSRIAFTVSQTQNDRIYTANLDGSDIQRAAPNEQAAHYALDWSSDGARFVFVSAHDPLADGIYSADSTGFDVRRIPLDFPPHPATDIAYWTPNAATVQPFSVPVGMTWTTFGAEPLVDASNPISAAQHTLELLLSGTLDTDPGWVCPEFLEVYLGISEAARGEFADLDLSDVNFTLVGQADGVAEISLSGTMHLRVAGARRSFPASLIPVEINPITTLYLYDAGRWMLCTPL